MLTAAQLLANDSIAPDSGETLSIQSVQGAVNGSVALNPTTNQITFTPTANYFGPASFTYTISDGNGGSATATVNLTVAAVNDNPTAVNDSFNAREDQPLVLTAAQLLANDSIAPDSGETLSIQSVQGAVNGSVALNPTTNQITFTPTANYFGPASFTYTISDGNGGSATATVNLTVEADANDDPTANNDSFNATEDQPLVLTAAQLLANDSIAPDSGETLSIQSVQGAVNGSVALNPTTNQITFTPTANYFGPASFTYTISDGNGGSADGHRQSDRGGRRQR